MSFGVSWAIISRTALILMPWTLSLLVWFFSRKFAQSAHFTASAIVLCTLPIQNIVISYNAHIFYYEVVRNYGATERFPYQQCLPLRTFLNLLTVVLNPNWLDIDHMLRKLLGHFNSL